MGSFNTIRNQFVFLGSGPFSGNGTTRCDADTAAHIAVHLVFTPEVAVKELEDKLHTGASPGAVPFGIFFLFDEESVAIGSNAPCGALVLFSKCPRIVKVKAFAVSEDKRLQAQADWTGSMPSSSYARVLDRLSGKMYLVNAARDKRGLVAGPGDLGLVEEVWLAPGDLY
jgi:hypothetical protein